VETHPLLRSAATRATICLTIFAAVAGQAHAQEPASGVPVTGVVLDAASGAPIAGALVSLDSSGRAIADTQGRFTIRNVEPGQRQLVVERFGYARYEGRITVSPNQGPIEFRLQADPVQLQGLTVTGGARVSVSGAVLDAVTGEPVSSTSLFLTRDAVRETAEDTSDRQGIFTLRGVPTGEYLLRVQRLGYVSQYLHIAVDAPPDPIEVRLEPDSVVLRGLVTFDRQLRSRRNSYLGIATAYEGDRMLLSGSPDAMHFLEYQTWVTPIPCDPGMRSSVCVIGRGGRPTEARVFIDELPVMGSDQLDVLHSYRPQDFYLIEVFGTQIIRAYTHEYAERQARRPRLMLPPGV
jgi:hypothetical protein